jgi:LemA protein
MEWILTGIFVPPVFLTIVIYNRLIEDNQRVKFGWSGISAQLKRRHDLIPKLVTAVKQCAAYEKATLENVTTIRNQVQLSRQVHQQAPIETKLNQSR